MGTPGGGGGGGDDSGLALPERSRSVAKLKPQLRTDLKDFCDLIHSGGESNKDLGSQELPFPTPTAQSSQGTTNVSPPSEAEW